MLFIEGVRNRICHRFVSLGIAQDRLSISYFYSALRLCEGSPFNATSACSEDLKSLTGGTVEGTHPIDRPGLGHAEEACFMALKTNVINISDDPP